MFLGGEISGAAVGCAFLDFSRHWRFLFGTIKVEPIQQLSFLFVGLHSRLGQFEAT
jgi:hypothetical protein